MRRTIAVLAFSALLASAAASVGLLPETTAAGTPDTEATFHVPDGDGYGIGECLAAGGECGQAVADAWCAAHGYARAQGYGRSAPEDTTGSVVLIAEARQAHPVAVTCSR
jgi:hypothetical protein